MMMMNPSRFEQVVLLGRTESTAIVSRVGHTAPNEN